MTLLQPYTAYIRCVKIADLLLETGATIKSRHTADSEVNRHYAVTDPADEEVATTEAHEMSSGAAHRMGRRIVLTSVSMYVPLKRSSLWTSSLKFSRARIESLIPKQLQLRRLAESFQL